MCKDLQDVTPVFPLIRPGTHDEHILQRGLEHVLELLLSDELEQRGPRWVCARIVKELHAGVRNGLWEQERKVRVDRAGDQNSRS